MLRNDLEYPLRKAWKYKLCNAWEYQKYRKASGYSGIKAALRCSSATCFAHKLLNASLHSFVHDCKDEVKLLKCFAMIGSTYSMMRKNKLRNTWEYQQYRKANGYSSIKAALRCPSATHLAHKPLNASLRSFVHDCKDEVKLLIR